MNTPQPSAIDLAGMVRDARQRMSRGPSGTDWLSAIRARGEQQVNSMPLPDRKAEDWRYTPVGFLDQADYRPLVDGPFEAIQASDIEELLLHDNQGIRLVFVNGYLAPALCPLTDDNSRVRVASLGGGLGKVPEELQRHLDEIAEHRHVFAALNSALMSDGALIHVPAGVASEHPIEILHVSVGLEDPGIAHPRHLIVLEEGARAEVIERYCSLGDGSYFNNAMIEVALAADSELFHQRLQEESRNAQHLSDLHVRLAARSAYHLTVAALGGAWSRTDVRVTFEGEGAHADLDGLMLAHDRQLNDIHLDVRHEVPNCSSRERFKGILDGKGRIVFDGHILVARDAQKTDAQLSNDNLMLSRSAEVDTKPQLEIYADDVKCSHGTTVGELDENMLFYLRSRGIGAHRAKQMLCQGFAAEVLQSMPNAAARERAGHMLAERLAEAAASDVET